MKKYIVLTFISMILTGFSIKAQSIESSVNGTGSSPDPVHFNNIFVKQTYASELGRIITEELEKRISENPSYQSTAKSAFQQIPLNKADISNYSFKDQGNGRSFTFETKTQYDQFVDFSYVYNQILELGNYRKSLLLTGSHDQNLRLLRSELTSATSFFNEGRFRVAKEFFNRIIENYSVAFTQLDDIYFLRAETYFGIKAYQLALQDYEIVLNKYGASSAFTNQSIYKILFIKYVYGKSDELISDWEKYKNYVTQQDQTFFNTQILLSVVSHQRSDFAKAISLIDKFPSDAGGYLLSRYIVGNSWASLDSVDRAIDSYMDIADISIWPWESSFLKYLKTSAQLQLGYLYYIKGIKTIHSANVEYDNVLANKLSGSAQYYFSVSKSYFAEITKKHPEYASSVLAGAWIDLQNAKYNDATLKVRGYINNVSDRDVIYQAVFLDGYIKQKKNPGDPTESQDSYYYVIDGMIANQFLTDFLENRRIISRQSIKTRDYLDTKSLPAASAEAGNSLLGLLDEIVKKISLSDNLKFTKENRVVSEDKIAQLVDDLNNLKKRRESVRSKGLRELILTADSASIALKNIIENPKAESIKNNEVLFAEHTPLLMQTTQNSMLNSYKDYRVVAGSEYRRISNQFKSVESALKTAKDIQKVPILAYFDDVLAGIAERYNAFEVALYERDFYTQQTEVERWGDAAGYGLSALLFQELERRKREDFEFSTTKGIIKKAISLKAAQMDEYLRDLAKIDEQEKFLSRIDSVNKDFKTKLVDYRSVYFNPISKREFPKDLLEKQKSNEPIADLTEENQKKSDAKKNPVKKPAKDVNVKKDSKKK